MGKNLFKSGNTAAKTFAKVGGKGVKISASVAKSKGKQALRSVKEVVTEAIGEEVEDSRGTRLTNSVATFLNLKRGQKLSKGGPLYKNFKNF
jgi:hypothetical protein